MTAARISPRPAHIQPPGPGCTPSRKAWPTSHQMVGTASTCSVRPCTVSVLASTLTPMVGYGSPKTWSASRKQGDRKGRTWVGFLGEQPGPVGAGVRWWWAGELAPPWGSHTGRFFEERRVSVGAGVVVGRGGGPGGRPRSGCTHPGRHADPDRGRLPGPPPRIPAAPAPTGTGRSPKNLPAKAWGEGQG